SESLILDVCLARWIDVVAELVEPMTVDLAEGPHVECHAAGVVMLLGKHALKSAAEQRSALVSRADKYVGEAHQPRQHDDEAWPYGVMKFLCLHRSNPPPFGECWLARRLRESRG